ncbi:MAG: hypothetical protein KF886_16060 [Candidatus Hydrogenedentes bacterium]|nr:hypothetical protein [Candidatus Hydrogenedentota bacterium]
MMKPVTYSLAVIAAVCGGGLSFWAVREGESRQIDALAERAVCELKLAPGETEVSRAFTLPNAIEVFHIGVRVVAEDERLSVLVHDTRGELVCSATLNRTTRYGGGRDIPPGNYIATLRQESGAHGGYAVISDRGVVERITGWQVYSRVFLGLVVASALWALFARRSERARNRVLSRQVAMMLSMAFLAMFMYLFFHEGGHALAELAFGRFDLASSDFWGIHGRPHSGGKPGVALAPWQQGLISGGGFIGPTLAGWLLYLLWITPAGRRLRHAYPAPSLYYAAVLAMALIPSVITPGLLLGLIDDGDWWGFVTHMPGPSWAIQGIVWISLFPNAWILWRIVPEFLRVAKAHFAAGAATRATESSGH